MYSIFSSLTPKQDTYYLLNNSTVRQVLEKMDFYKFTVLPVIDEEGKYVSTISEGDLLRFIKHQCDFDIKKAEAMPLESVPRHRSYKSLNVSATMREVAALAAQQNFVPVCDDRGIFMGIVTRSSIIKLLFDQSAFE